MFPDRQEAEKRKQPAAYLAPDPGPAYVHVGSCGKSAEKLSSKLKESKAWQLK